MQCVIIYQDWFLEDNWGKGLEGFEKWLDFYTDNKNIHS